MMAVFVCFIFKVVLSEDLVVVRFSHTIFSSTQLIKIKPSLNFFFGKIFAARSLLRVVCRTRFLLVSFFLGGPLPRSTSGVAARLRVLAPGASTPLADPLDNFLGNFSRSPRGLRHKSKRSVSRNICRAQRRVRGVLVLMPTRAPAGRTRPPDFGPLFHTRRAPPTPSSADSVFGKIPEKGFGPREIFLISPSLLREKKSFFG